MSVTHSDSLDLLAQALVKAQAQMQPALKDSTNPFFKSKYADLSSVWDACRDALHKNGLSVAQFPGYSDGAALLTTVLLHTSGQWMQGTAGAPLTKADAQSAGSVITYLRRYALAAVAGVVQEDDDGTAASHGKAVRGQQSGAGAKDAVPGPLAAAVRAQMPAQPLPKNGGAMWKGKPLADFKSDELVRLKNWCLKANPERFANEVQAMDEILAGRAGE